jgi:separase
MSISSTPDGWLNPLQIGLLDPPRMHCSPLLSLTKRFQHIPMNAPHWAHVFTVLLGAYVVTTTEGEVAPPGLQPLRPPTQLWETIRKWLVVYVGHSDVEVASRRIENAARLISDILDWSEQMIEARKETKQGWFSGKDFMNLLDFWVDISRKVSTLGMDVLT